MDNIDFFYKKYDLSDIQKEQYKLYYDLIYKYNKVMNLTGIDDVFGVYLKHYYDSLLIADDIPSSGICIADIGTGAGFPGIVLAIYFPNNTFELVEPLTKRCKFLEEVVKELRLKNVEIINKRAEDLVKEKYDIIVSRAVARLNILSELIVPFLKVGGTFIALKGSKGEEEVLEAKECLKKLGSSILEIKKEIIPFEESKRINIYIKKNKKTDKMYPRNFGQIKKRPL